MVPLPGRSMILTMAAIRKRGGGEEIVLSSQHLVGRAPRANLRINDNLVSGTHAEIRWDGATWELRDLDSRNGTFVDGEKLAPSERRTVMTGSRIAFGDPDDVYVLIDDKAPCPNAVSSDGTRREALEGPLLLPDPDNVVYFVYQEGPGWHAEDLDGVGQAVVTGDLLQIGDASWTLDLPMITERTRSLGDGKLTVGTITLRFTVSRNEEHVDLDLIHDGKKTRLPDRAYWYTLLNLARVHYNDRQSGVEREEMGWIHIDDLTAMLGIEHNTLHQHLCRAKRSLARVKVIDYSRLVERRTQARQLRIGVHDIEIVNL